MSSNRNRYRRVKKELVFLPPRSINFSSRAFFNCLSHLSRPSVFVHLSSCNVPNDFYMVTALRQIHILPASLCFPGTPRLSLQLSGCTDQETCPPRCERLLHCDSNNPNSTARQRHSRSAAAAAADDDDDDDEEENKTSRPSRVTHPLCAADGGD